MDEQLSAAISEAARSRHITIGVAESLTGGLLSASLAKAPEAAEWFRGGIVAYSREVKEDLLGVSAGPVVTERCATEMAQGALKALGADIAVAVTGVGGPGPEEGQPAGTVWLVIGSSGWAGSSRLLHLDGDPPEVCRATCEAAGRLLLECLGEQP